MAIKMSLNVSHLDEVSDVLKNAAIAFSETAKSFKTRPQLKSEENTVRTKLAENVWQDMADLLKKASNDANKIIVKFYSDSKKRY